MWWYNLVNDQIQYYRELIRLSPCICLKGPNSGGLGPAEVRGDTITYIGLGLAAVGLVVTVVGLGDKVNIQPDLDICGKI